jgi:hypothetical protein
MNAAIAHSWRHADEQGLRNQEGDMQPVKLAERLSYGNEETCSHAIDASLAIVHACKIPCHRRAVGYTNNLASSHQHYLVYENGHHLYLNLIDPPQLLFMMPCFEAFLRFVDREIAEREVLIHCNQGESRAPSLALLYMAKRLWLLPSESYDEAAESFRSQFTYRPGEGIKRWLTANWQRIA